jgi:hypothetical protein
MEIVGRLAGKRGKIQGNSEKARKIDVSRWGYIRRGLKRIAEN